MVCPQRNWIRTWIFNSSIGVQLKKAAMYSGNVFVVNYVPRTHQVGPCNLQKQSFLSIFYDLGQCQYIIHVYTSTVIH